MSIIVPAYNPGVWLRPCVESILNQSMTDLELLLVDDGSQDGSIDQLKLDDARLKIIRQPNRGAAAARNTGLSHAGGRWISFVDADDILHRDKLGHQLEYLAMSPALQLTSGSWCRFHTDVPEVPQVHADDLWRPQQSINWQVTALRHHLMMQPAAWLAARALVEAVGPWNETLSLNDDGEYFARLMLNTDKVGFCPRSLSFYRSGSDQSLSAGRTEAHFQSAVNALSLIAGSLEAAAQNSEHDGGGQTDAARSALALAWSRLAVESYPYAVAQSRICEQRARQLGPFKPDIGGGRWVRRLAGPLGWRLTRRLQAFVYDVGYRRLGQLRQRQPARGIHHG